MRPPADGCAGRLGIDPDALQTACGLGPLISHDDLGYACELRYTGADGHEPVFTFREHRNRDPEQAWALHQTSFAEGIEAGSFADIEGSHWHRHQGYRWAYLPGWTHGRRVGWLAADCTPEQMQPVLGAMATAPQPKPDLAPRWARPEPLAGVFAESLSSRYGARDDLRLEDLDERELPTLAKKLVVALLSAAAREDIATVRGLLAPHASFGLPDRREYDAWPLDSTASVETFTANLDLVAQRFDAEAAFSCPALQREHIDAVTRGAQPMWCFFTSADGLDLLTFRLRTFDGRGQVDYIGMFEAAPSEQLQLAPGEPNPPPLTPASDS